MLFRSALFAIVLIDLVLAGDNALVIGLVARNLPKHMQRKVIFWGTFGAIAIRIVMAMMVVWILKVPGFMLAGGLALIWIAYKLLTPQDASAHAHAAAPAASFAAAIRTIVIADAVMGLDNVLAVAGAAAGHETVMFIGLATSIALMGLAAAAIARLLDRFKWIAYIGLALIVYVAVEMLWEGGHEVLALLH